MYVVTWIPIFFRINLVFFKKKAVSFMLNSWTTGLCHFYGYSKWEYIFSKYSQLHSLTLLVSPLCLVDHQSLWCSELETPSPILFPWHWWRTCTGASSPAQENSGKGETTIKYNTWNTGWFSMTKWSCFLLFHSLLHTRKCLINLGKLFF